MAHIEVDGLGVEYRNPRTGEVLKALDGIRLDVERGEFVAVVGPSGCGKSTLLLCIDGLLRPSQGQVRVDGKVVTSPGPDRAMVFQEFALLPWRANDANTWFPLELRGRPASELRAAATHFLSLVGLRGFEHSYPHQLSGGMRQRVGIARALAARPDILLMDEPFGALDPQTRELMQAELLKVWEQHRKTVVFVTHSIDEAVYLADRIVVMTARPGRVREVLEVGIPRPRELEVKDLGEFTRLRRHIWRLLADQVSVA